MESNFPPSGAAASSSVPVPDADLAFAFNDSNFSDRVLRIEIIPDSPETKWYGDCCSTLAHWAGQPKKRRQEIKKDNVVDSVVHREEPVLSHQILDMVDFVCENKDEAAVAMVEEPPARVDRNRFVKDCVGENKDEEAVAMVEELPADAGFDKNQCGDEAAHRGDSLWNVDNLAVLKVKNMHISSAILAAKSPFFYKLFTNGMKESEQRDVTLRIHASEEAALMDLLNFMYSNALTVRTPPALLDVLMAADKFEVPSCMGYCSRLLRELPMTHESALLYLDLPSSVLIGDAVQPLAEVAKQFLAGVYKDMTKFQNDLLNLPLAGIEAVLASDGLQVASEDAVFDFVLKWARSQYSILEERKEVIGSRLAFFIHFPFVTCRKLKKVLNCNEFDSELSSKFVREALFFKAEASYRKRSLTAQYANSVHHRYVERAYKYRPVKVVDFELPRPECIVYLNLKREELACLFPAGRLYSQAFHLGGKGFFLSAHCNIFQQNSCHNLGLFLGMQKKGESVAFSFDYEFAMRSKETKDYVSKCKGNYTFTGGKAVGCRNLLGIPWTTFMAEDSPYFIDGILHLRAEVTIKQ